MHVRRVASRTCIDTEVCMCLCVSCLDTHTDIYAAMQTYCILPSITYIHVYHIVLCMYVCVSWLHTYVHMTCY